METLTKENFWNEMEQKYPKAMAHFLNWIDGYKEANAMNWPVLFRNVEANLGVKYHELPIAVQFGIFVEYGLHCVSLANQGGASYRGFQVYTNNLRHEFGQVVNQIFTIVTFDILKEDHP